MSIDLYVTYAIQFFVPSTVSHARFVDLLHALLHMEGSVRSAVGVFVTIALTRKVSLSERLSA
jgi:hypothetical protein